MPTCIDPTRLKLDSVEQSLLSNYIWSKPNQNFFKKDEPYMANNGTEFSLTHSILRRERKLGKEGFRFEVIDIEIDKGYFGKIYKISNTLGFLNNSQLITKTNKEKHRVVKEQLCNDKKNSQLIEAEDKITSIISHLHTHRR